MKIENKGNLRVLTAESGYITQNTNSVIDSRIYVKAKMLLPTESESDYKEVSEILEMVEMVDNEQTLEQRITDIEQVTEEVITALNDKGIVP